MEYILYDRRIGYYLGKDYTHDGDRFPFTTNERSKAKIYKSLKTANRVSARINNRLSCSYYFEPVEFYI